MPGLVLSEGPQPRRLAETVDQLHLPQMPCEASAFEGEDETHEERHRHDAVDVDGGPPAHLPVLDHVGADRLRAEAEASAAVVLVVASSTASAADLRSRNDGHTLGLDRVAEDAPDVDCVLRPSE